MPRVPAQPCQEGSCGCHWGLVSPPGASRAVGICASGGLVSPLPGVCPLAVCCRPGRELLPGHNAAFEGGRHHVPPLPCSHLPGHPSPQTKGAAARPHGGFIVLCPGWGMRRGVTLHQASWMRAPRGGGGVWDVSRGCSLAPGGLPGDIWLLSFSATAVLGGGLRPSRRVPGRGAPMSVGVRGPQLSSSGTGAAAGLRFFSSASAAAGRSRAGLGLECRCLRMKGKTLRAERG